MATQNINNSPEATAIASTDDIFISKGGTALQKIDYDKLASAIITQYTVNGLAGSNQAVSAAINALNSNINSLDHYVSYHNKTNKSTATGLIIHGTTGDIISQSGWKITYIPVIRGVHVKYRITFPSSLGSSVCSFSTSVPEAGGTSEIINLYTNTTGYDVDYTPSSDGYLLFASILVENTLTAISDNLHDTLTLIKEDVDELKYNLGDPNTAGFHNGIYRGKDITSYLTDGSLWNRIKGTGGYALFDDLFLGDYITVGSNSYAIVDFDYYLRTGSVDVTEHHIVMMPVSNMNIPAGTVLYGSSDTLTLLNGSDVTSKETATSFKWNATAEAPNANSTNGGYKFSRMRTIIMKAADTIVVNAFGASHVKPITVLYPNFSDASASGLASGWVWFDQDDLTKPMRKSICDLPNETQIYGQQVFGRGSAYTNVGFEIGVDKFQFALCGLQKNFVNNRAYYWLRSVISASLAAFVDACGTAGTYGSAGAFGVRPRFLLVG